MSKSTSIRERYHNDPVFANIVDMLRQWLQQHDFTPTELREAALLAAMMHDLEFPKPLIIGDQVWEMKKA